LNYSMNSTQQRYLFGNPVIDYPVKFGRYGTHQRNKWGVWLINPMLKLGSTPGRICKECDYLIKTGYHGRVYYKCHLRGCTRGGQTDHRLKWPACSKFIPNTECQEKIKLEERMLNNQEGRHNLMLGTIVLCSIIFCVLIWIFT